MKKLMIAAAVAAMGASAFAAETWTTNYNYGLSIPWTSVQSKALFEPFVISSTNKITGGLGGPTTNWTRIVSNEVELDKLQIITYKNKATSTKFFCLNNEKNETEKFYKPSANSSWKNQAVDGAIYYDEKLGWMDIAWSKDKEQNSVSTNGLLVTTFNCFADKGGKKVWGAMNGATVSATETNNVAATYNATALTAYAQIVDKKVKSIKSLGNLFNSKYSLKTYKDAAARDKAIEKIKAKYEKAGGKF